MDNTSNNVQETLNDGSIVFLRELDIYDILNITEENFRVMDVYENKLLINIFCDAAKLSENDSKVISREQGITAVTTKLIVLDINLNQIIYEYMPEKRVFCTDGIFLEDKLVFGFITIEESLECTFSIELSEQGLPEKDMIEIQSGLSFASDGYFPEVERLGNGIYVYSYTDIDIGEFGTCLMNGNVEVQRDNLPLNEKNQPLRGGLKSNNGYYMVYVVKDELGMILLGNVNQEVSYLPLEENERMFDYCFVRDGILLSLENSVSVMQAGNHQLVVRDYDGNTVFSNSIRDCYRMVSNGDNLVLCIDNHYATYILRINEDSITKNIIKNIPVAPVLFFSTDSGRFLAHIYSEYAGNDQRMLIDVTCNDI